MRNKRIEVQASLGGVSSLDANTKTFFGSRAI